MVAAETVSSDLDRGLSPAMTLSHDFIAAQARLLLADSAAELLPEQLVMACVEILPVDGATLTLFNTDGTPLPIGTSGRDAATAESLQFTTAEGPCRQAWSTQQPVLADEMSMAARWPLFYDELVSFSPFRAMVSSPLRHGLGRTGTLNLLLCTDAGFSEFDLEDVHEVNDVISQALLLALTPPTPLTRSLSEDGERSRHWSAVPGPAWLGGPDEVRRSTVFVAIGLLRDALNISELDSLALLRARAYATGQTVDNIASALTALHLDSADLDPFDTP